LYISNRRGQQTNAHETRLDFSEAWPYRVQLQLHVDLDPRRRRTTACEACHLKKHHDEEAKEVEEQQKTSN
jgi:hypothetical protein